MSAITDTNQKVFLIRELLEQGYRDKQICMIARAKQPYVSKVKHRRIHKDTELEEGQVFSLTEKQQKRKDALDKIMTLPEYTAAGATAEDDLVYIQVLKFFLADQNEVYKLYFHLSRKHFSRLWATKDVDIRMFDATKIGIEREVYLDLIIDFFLD